MKGMVLLIILLLTGCGREKTGDLKSRGVEGFHLERYLGTWNEIERIDNSFERGLTRVTAHYYIDPKGRYRVVNRGYDEKKERYKEVRGYIRPTDRSGVLKVSFFRPFYADYIVLDIDESYTHALVGGGTADYLWILSRDEEVPSDIRERFISRAREMGYEYRKLQTY